MNIEEPPGHIMRRCPQGPRTLHCGKGDIADPDLVPCIGMQIRIQEAHACTSSVALRTKSWNPRPSIHRDGPLTSWCSEANSPIAPRREGVLNLALLLDMPDSWIPSRFPYHLEALIHRRRGPSPASGSLLIPASRGKIRFANRCGPGE